MGGRLRVVQVLEATSGGTRKHLLDLCRGLDPEGFELHAVLSPVREQRPGELGALLGEMGVGTVSLPMRRRPDPSDWRNVRLLETVLRELKPDIVHCHSSKAGLVGRLAAWRAGVPATIYTPHGFSFCMNVAWPLRWSFLQAERWLGRRTTALIAVCEGERETALRAGVVREAQIRVVHNGVVATALPRVDRGEVLAGLGLGPESRVVLCVGGLRAQKGHDLAIRAMREVLAAVPEASLVIAGDGPDRAALLRLAQRVKPSRLRLMGEREEVGDLLAVCDVFCQPSRWEGCPYSVLEACAAGRPVVGFGIAGIRDVIEDGKSGWLAAGGDVRGLGACLLAALADGEERARRGAAGRRVVEARFGLEQMVEGTAQVYRQVAGRL